MNVACARILTIMYEFITLFCENNRFYLNQKGQFILLYHYTSVINERHNCIFLTCKLFHLLWLLFCLSYFYYFLLYPWYFFYFLLNVLIAFPFLLYTLFVFSLKRKTRLFCSLFSLTLLCFKYHVLFYFFVHLIYHNALKSHWVSEIKVNQTISAKSSEASFFFFFNSKIYLVSA